MILRILVQYYNMFPNNLSILDILYFQKLIYYCREDFARHQNHKTDDNKKCTYVHLQMCVSNNTNTFEHVKHTIISSGHLVWCTLEDIAFN